MMLLMMMVLLEAVVVLQERRETTRVAPGGLLPWSREKSLAWPWKQQPSKLT